VIQAGSLDLRAKSEVPPLSRRRLLPGAGLALVPGVAGLMGSSPASASSDDMGRCTTIPAMPTAKRPEPQRNWLDFSRAETDLAFRNHGMLAELLREPITPLGAHYLLVHFDIPRLSDENYAVAIGGRVRSPTQVTLGDLKGRQAVSQVVTMECAGTGRSTLNPRPVYVPWSDGAIGTYQWIGTPLRPLLEQAGLLGDAKEILFTGWDTGVDLGVEHAFERSMPVEDALHPEVMLAWAANGQPLLPEHGFPLRLIVPSWYGMASVKWLRAITALSAPFQGVQQAQVYRYTQDPNDPGEPVREKRVTSVMIPPGIPDLLSRQRFLAPGKYALAGRAWSGNGPITKVEVSADGGHSWYPTQLVPVSNDPAAWVGWQTVWTAGNEDAYSLACRATDATGATQPLDPNEAFNLQGNGINGVRQIAVVVQKGVGSAGRQVPSVPKLIIPGAKVPPATGTINQAVMES
jgi:DMSO/TMAO reductase YedYZ molybdopterin-dependent catalytic subunit